MIRPTDALTGMSVFQEPRTGTPPLYLPTLKFGGGGTALVELRTGQPLTNKLCLQERDSTNRMSVFENRGGL